MMNPSALIRSIDLNSLVVQVPGRIAADLGTDAAVLNPDSGTYFKLNALGSVIWGWMASPSAVSELSERMFQKSQKFGVTRERCQEDVIKVLAKLEKFGLVKVVDSADA